jgi:parvulin-like peptidyl-prolyl isomerase
MDPSFEKAATQKLNVVGQPVHDHGWHIVEVLDRDTLKTHAGRDSLSRDGKPILEAHIRHVLLRVPVTDEDVTRARELAEPVRAHAVAGSDFAVLARKYSRYSGPQSDGGRACV